MSGGAFNYISNSYDEEKFFDGRDDFKSLISFLTEDVYDPEPFTAGVCSASMIMGKLNAASSLIQEAFSDFEKHRDFFGAVEYWASGDSLREDVIEEHKKIFGG